MLIIVDHRIGVEALNKLQGFGEIILFPESKAVYPAISSHPDIFIFQAEETIIVAPNTPKIFLEELDRKGVSYLIGNNTVGAKYPETVYYNVAYRDDLLICNETFCDDSIRNEFASAKNVYSKQGYARCNHLILDKNHVLSSDLPTVQKLENALYVDPKFILLSGFEHGFFGGCCGIFDKTLVVNGRLSTLENEKEIRAYVSNAGYDIVELSQSALHDVGSIFFITDTW